MHVPDELDPQTRADLAAHVSRVRHDLGRYVVFQQRWLPDDAGDDERTEALKADLLATRRGPEGTLDASAVWADLRRPLVGEEPLVGGSRVDLAGDPDLAALDAAMARVCLAIAGLRSGSVDLAEGSGAAADVSRACDALWRRWRVGGS